MGFHSCLVMAKGLSFQLPDGRMLFNGLNFSIGRQRIGLVGANGVGKSSLLKLIAGQLSPSQGIIERAGRLSFLPQNLVLAAKEQTTDVDLNIGEILGVATKLQALSHILAGEASPGNFEIIGDDWDLREKCERIMTSTGLVGFELERPWKTLSCGERMKLLFARLLLEEPNLILLDEPTNHLDSQGRDCLSRLLLEFAGGILIVSHDRELLNEVQEIWELSERGLRVYGGGFDFYKDARGVEQAAAQHQIENARQELDRREQELRAGKERQLKRMAKGQKVGESGGIPRIIRGALKRQAQETLGKTLDRNESLVSGAKTELLEARERFRNEDRIKIDFGDDQHPPGGKGAKASIEVRDFNMCMPENTNLLWAAPVSFTLRGTERIAIVGPNGAGKTSLLREIVAATQEGNRKPGPTRTSGTVRVNARIAYLDQTVSILDREDSLLEAYTSFTPHLTESERRIRLARFLFPGDKVHVTCRSLSGGERLRAGLLCLLSMRPAPSVLILDEPTNNLDLPSIETLEEALREMEVGLLLVSHDQRFLDAVGVSTRVSIERA